MLTDVQIAQQAKMEPIIKIANKIGLSEDDIECYGKYKAKINFEAIKKVENNKKGKLVLVSAINPTSAGEGKTTTMIGLAMALNQLNKNTIVAMREPSLGPCFGIKGGACGGGYSQVVPMEDINLHFTGDIHAITTANNLIAAMLDNSLQQGNLLNIDPRTIVWKRCVDLNDRSLRHIVVGLGGKSNGVVREDGFDISVASEVMAVLCLANDLKDLKQRIARMIVAYTYEGKPVTVDDLQATGAVTLLLKDAIKPNLVQTLENTPVLIHGGPFANIAHGCNSVIATKLAMSLSEITLTEAGFGADLGAEKFFDIKCRSANLKPDAVVLVATIRALKLNGGLDNSLLKNEDMDSLIKGSCNLEKHIENIKKYNLPVLVTLNVFDTDTQNEIDYVKDLCAKNNVSFSLSKVFEQGGAGGIEAAKQLIDILDNTQNQFSPLYDLDLPVEEKIETIVKQIYGGKGISYSKKIENKINKCKELGFNNLPICIAKTQYSLSDNPKLLGRPENFIVEISDVIVNAGSGFIVAVCGDIMRMPGLPKKPAAINMDIDDNGTITGLF